MVKLNVTKITILNLLYSVLLFACKCLYVCNVCNILVISLFRVNWMKIFSYKVGFKFVIFLETL